jgi:alpha-2-macroglobulin-like protein
MREPYTHVIDCVDDYLHDVLDRAEADYVERHCETCRICKVALEEARKRFAALDTVPGTEASESLIQSTLAHIDRHDRERRRNSRIVGGAVASFMAAAVLIIGTVHLYFLNLSASPYDLRLLGQTTLLAGSKGSLRVQLFDHRHNAALQGIPITIDLYNPAPAKFAPEFVHLASFTTNMEGSGQPQFELPDWPDGTYELQVTAATPGGSETLRKPVRLRRSWKLMLTSDKPVYQPGQTIHVRSLALRRPDLKPVAGQDALFTIADPKGTIIFKRRDLTSAYGIAAIDCPLATEIIEGPYTIACKIGDTESKATVEVHKYVLPKFKVDVELDQPFYQPGQTLRGKVRASYFFGKPLAKAAVKIELVTTDTGANVPRKLDLHMDEKGESAFSMALPTSLVGVEQHSGDAAISLRATVTDTAGQKQEKIVKRIVSAAPLRIEVIPESGRIVGGVPNRIYFFTSYPDGRPARTSIILSGNENPVHTNALGVAMIEIGGNWVGQDALVVKVSDEEGHSVTREVKLDATVVADDFLLRTDKAVYRSGDTIHFLALGGGVEPVFVDLIKDGQTVLTEMLEMRAGQATYQFDVPPDLVGAIEVCAYRFGDAGVAVRKSRVIYIQPADQIKIRAALDRADYRPGQQAKLDLTLTDANGKPRPGAVSLAAVDEAVYAVSDQRLGTERAVFASEQKLLEPVYQLYPWSPDLTIGGSAEDRLHFEQALFARTAQEPTRNGRSAVQRELLPFLDFSERTFEVLQRQDWEKLLGPNRIPKEVIAALRNERALHTLAESSYADKLSEIEARKRAGLKEVHGAWVVFGILAGVLLLTIVIALLGRTIIEVVVVIGILIILMGLVLPATQTIREASTRVKAQNDLHQIALAVENYKDVHGRLPGESSGQTKVSSPRVRDWFPETPLWRPEVITDDSGRARIPIDLADSITTWRLLASAVTADGRLGAASVPIRVFQPFFVELNLPVSLTRGDEVVIPVVVYNYLPTPHTVELTLGDGDWFQRLDASAQRIDLKPNEVRSSGYRIRVTKVGKHRLQVTAHGAGVADALQRDIEVVPDGRRIEQVFNGTLQQPAAIALTIPASAIEGSPKAILKIYPSTFSEVVEGLDGIFQMPYGCFEQTSSTTYPNVLALDYLRRTDKNAPAIEAKARQYIHLGYQRLLTFEVPGGGFDWFGRPPANLLLTAYGLMEFQDMAQITHDVDPQLIDRTRRWLLARRAADGSWPAERHGLHDNPATDTLASTAYIAWAVYSDPSTLGDAGAAQRYLLSHPAETISDTYTLALVCHALLAMRSELASVAPYLARLESLKRSTSDGKLAWWEESSGGLASFYAAGRCGNIQTTALAALAFIEANSYAATTRAALAWLVQQKGPSGTWYSTQATVLSLKALLAATAKPLGDPQERRIEMTWDNGKSSTLVIPADQGDVMQQIDLSERLSPGNHQLRLREHDNGASVYQLSFHYHVPGPAPSPKSEPLAITVAYDRTELTVGDSVQATATVVNQMAETAPMVILDLPIPPGFTAVSEDLSDLVRSDLVAKYQVTPQRLIVYLRSLEPRKPLTLRYRLSATMPVKLTVPPAIAYEYYNPDKRAATAPARLVVSQAR